MGRHTYLIIAHNNWSQLLYLITLLQDSYNDFFILIDSKATDFDKNVFLSNFHSNNIFFTKQVDIRWGDYSQIEAELELLRASTSHANYDYYHLISGVDMPLKSQREIHAFFEKNKGYEFVDFDNYENNTEALDRAKYHYFLQPIVGRKKVTFLKVLRDLFVLLEFIIRINRVKDIEDYLGKGSNWFSITDSFARYVVDNTYCCDEVFLQTMLKMSPFGDKWYGFKNKDIQYQNLRYSDWGRGKPYTFTKSEFFELTKSEYLFARKFSNDIISDDVRDIIVN